MNLVTPLHRAASRRQTEIMRLLCDNGADYAAKSELYDHALAAATHDKGQSGLDLLVARGADVNSHLTNYGSLLQFAVRHANLDTIQNLLDKGAEVNAYGGMYGNMLQAAMSEDNVRDGLAVHIIGLLLDKGANINAGTERHGNALDFAEERLESLVAQAAKSSADCSEEINDTEMVVSLLRRRGTLRSRELKNNSSVSQEDWNEETEVESFHHESEF